MNAFSTLCSAIRKTQHRIPHPTPRRSRIPPLGHLCACLLAGLVSGAQAAGTALDVSAAGTGAEILTDGTLVAANHFGGVSDGMSAAASITLANGLTFGTSTTHMTSGWTPVHSTSTDAHAKVPLLTDSTVFGQLTRRYFWIAYSSSVSHLDIPGLTVGKTYRLQLISPNPANCSVSLEGGTAMTWSGSTPSVLSLTWTAADATANVILTRTAGEIDFIGYALHDMTAAAPAAPTGLAATPGNAQVGLTWTAAGGATGYNVKRSTTSGSGYVQVGTPTLPAFTDSPLVNGTPYYYVVSATNATGESANSSQASATPTAAQSSAKDLLTFSFGALGSANISGTTVVLTVPYGTAVTALAPTYTMSPFATCAPVSGSTQNFASPVHYVVTAQDSSTKDYTVTVSVAAASSAKDFLTFGPGATIGATTVAWSVPYGTVVTSLAPTYTVSALATGSPASGSSRDFSTPLLYTITAQDGSTKVYTVTVTVASVQTVTQLNVNAGGNGSEIVNDGTLVAANHFGGVGDGMSAPAAVTLANGLLFGTSTAHLTYNWAPVHSTATWAGAAAITDVPFKTLLSNVFWLAGSQIPQLNIPGLTLGHTYRLQLISDNPQNASVVVENNPAVTWSGATPSVLTATWFQEYSGDTVANITLTRTAGEINFNGYALHDLSTANSLKNISSFTFPGLGAATLAGTNISIAVPYGTNVASLAPTYTLTSGATCVPASGAAVNFSTPQTYTVTAPDHSTKTYTVTVNVAAVSTAKDILACSFGALGSADINGTTVTMTVPIGTAVTSLAPTFTLSPLATINPVSGGSQNFTNAVSYTVTAQDGSTKVYSVAVRSYAAWQYSASLFVLTTPEGADLAASAAESNFPLLVRLNSKNFAFSQAQSDGRDLRFTTAAGSELSYQIEQWDAVAGTASVWVKIPSLVGNARQEIKMYWGKADALAESSAANVFNSANGYVSVFHLAESVQDEVGTLTPVNAGSTVAGGLIGNGRHFVAGSGINCGDAITNYPYSNNPFTSECWFRTEVIGGSPLYWGRYATRYDGATGDGDEVNIAVGAPASLGWSSDGPGGATAATVPSVGQWYHVAAVYANGVSQIYVNGKLDGTRSGGSTAMSVFNNIQMKIGGWRGSYNFAGDIDEVRVSQVARSADWMKLQYENQKALQTLVGPPVQSGSALTVAPTTVTMNEGTATTLTAQAGGAQKIYWIRRQNGQDTVLAVDQFALDFSAGRVSGDQSFVLELQAVYPTQTKTIDVPVTITEYLPDPAFTLTAPAAWDGRQTITVTPNISNLAAMQAKGVAGFNYVWSVAGLAVAKQITPGVLTLTRAQASGPLSVTLTMDNGGAPVTSTTTIAVQEPASDAWVHRTPAPDEKPANGQFFARDDTGFGQIYYNGTLAGSPDTVYLKVYTTTTGSDVLYSTLRQALVGGAYKFSAPIAPGLVTYKVVFGSSTGGTDTDLATVTNLVCGDAYLIDGQSNAVADNSDNPYSSPWIRSFGNMTGGTASGWGNAVRASNMGDAYRIGYWAMDLAVNLVAAYNVPICIINGAVGGTLVSQHQANPADHTAAGSDYSIYANLLTRVAAANLTHGIRGVLWHQGENNSGAAAPTGDWDYKSYQQYFVDMAAAWKQDYPNIQHYYIFQVWPLPCGMGPKGDQLRDVQRTLPRLFSNMSIMSTVGVSGSRGLCHFDSAGYAQIANLLTPLVMRDNNGLAPATDITAPDLKRAYFTTPAKTEIALEFGQNMLWSSAATVNLYLDKLGGKVTSGSVTGKVIKLQVTAASASQTLDYLEDASWDGTSGNLLRGSNNIAALTFADVTIGPPPPTSLVATAGSNQVALSWSAPSGATGYNVKRALTTGGAYSLIGTTSGMNYTDTTAAGGTPYYYVVSGTTSVSGTAGEGADSNEASATPTSTGVTFASWIGTKGLSGPAAAADADPDRDGLSNALEYVLGGEPNPATAGANSVGLLPKVSQGGNNMIFTFRRSAMAFTQPGNVITPEYGSALAGWTAAQNGVNGVTITVTPDGFGSGIDKVEVSIPQALAVGRKLFAHLKVTIP